MLRPPNHSFPVLPQPRLANITGTASLAKSETSAAWAFAFILQLQRTHALIGQPTSGMQDVASSVCGANTAYLHAVCFTGPHASQTQPPSCVGAETQTVQPLPAIRMRLLCWRRNGSGGKHCLSHPLHCERYDAPLSICGFHRLTDH